MAAQSLMLSPTERKDKVLAYMCKLWRGLGVVLLCGVFPVLSGCQVGQIGCKLSPKEG